jgi:hypothetical protein
LITFEFASIGFNGSIQKLIQFSQTDLIGVYNLAFGDKNLETGEIDDLAISNNGDIEKVLATVVAAVYTFTEKYPSSFVYATGSTKSRTRLYQIGITKYLEEGETDFSIYGQLNEEWYLFEKGVNYDAFLVKRKK